MCRDHFRTQFLAVRETKNTTMYNLSSLCNLYYRVLFYIISINITIAVRLILVKKLLV
jgi:hypothetical protein